MGVRAWHKREPEEIPEFLPFLKMHYPRGLHHRCEMFGARQQDFILGKQQDPVQVLLSLGLLLRASQNTTGTF